MSKGLGVGVGGTRTGDEVVEESETKPPGIVALGGSMAGDDVGEG